jgi:hypothetical protein
MTLSGGTLLPVGPKVKHFIWLYLALSGFIWLFYRALGIGLIRGY